MTALKLDIHGRTVTVSRPEKILFPEPGYTKADVCRYTALVAPVRRPYVRDRPVTLHRYPDGVTSDGFYQRSTPDHFPDWVDTATVPSESSGTKRLVTLGSPATEVYLADQGAFEVHAWTSRATHLEQPDRLVLDLDPPQDGFQAVREAAFELKDLLESLHLSPYLMTTGQKGLHIHCPLKPGPGFKTVRKLARVVCNALVEQARDRYTIAHRKNKRGDRVFLDIFRNGRSQTSVAPYCLRPRAHAPVAAPIRWSELDDPDLRPDSITLDAVVDRLEDRGDPWEGIEEDRVAVDAIVDILSS